MSPMRMSLSGPKILAIETATKACSVAAAQGQDVLGEISLFIPQVHVERLVTMIGDLLEDVRLKHADLDAVAVSIGPGSFTGLRIGLSVAKGIAFALNKKIIAVPTLDAIAHGASGSTDGKLVVPILHARGDEFYYTTPGSAGSATGESRAGRIAGADSLVGEFRPGTLFVGEGARNLAQHENARDKFGAGSFVDMPASASNVAYLAIERYEKGDFADIRTVVPLYIKDFIAVKGNPLKKLAEKI